MIIIHRGEFGRAVSHSLAMRVREATILSLGEAQDHTWTRYDAQFVAFALSGKYPIAVGRLAEQFGPLGIPHSVAALTDHLLLCGPLVLPGKAPCRRCALRRMASMIEKPWTAKQDQNLHAHLEACPGEDLRGHLPTLVEMAALKLLRHSECRPDDAGRLSAASLIEGRTVETRVLALHGCECRGRAQLKPEERRNAGLQAAFGGLVS